MTKINSYTRFKHTPMNQKSLILSIPAMLAVFLLGGWLLLREPHSIPESQNPPQSGEGNTSKNPPIPKISKSPEMLRDEKLVSQIAFENGEPESGIRISLSSVSEHHVAGQAFLSSDSRKKVFFIATDVYRDPSLVIGNSNREQQEDSEKVVYREWTVFTNNGHDITFDCGEMRAYHFPANMMKECVNKPSKNSGSSGKIIVSKSWRRVSGDPKEDCSEHVFEGKVTVGGWYEWRQNYVGREWMLVLREGDERKIVTSWPWQVSFSLSGASPELIEQLKNAGPVRPIMLDIKRFGFYCEGSPWVSL